MGSPIPAEAFAPSVHLRRDRTYGEIPLVRGDRYADAAGGPITLWPTATGAGHEWPHPIWRVGQIEGFETYGSGRSWRCTAFVLVDELPAWHAFGPRGEIVTTFIERLVHLDASVVRSAPDLVHELRWGWSAVEDLRVRVAWHLEGFDETAQAMTHAHNALREAIYKRIDETTGAVDTNVYWEDEYRQRHITDRGWAATAEAAARLLASIILEERLSPSDVADLAAPWREIVATGTTETRRLERCRSALSGPAQRP